MDDDDALAQLRALSTRIEALVERTRQLAEEKNGQLICRDCAY